MEARSKIGGRDAATGTAATATEIGTIGRTQQSHAHFPETLVAGESLPPFALFIIRNTMQVVLLDYKNQTNIFKVP